MNDLSVTKPYQRRRRFSREFKAQIVAQCLEPGASVSRISLDNGLNANMVRRWISEARRAPKAPATTPGFVPVNLPTVASAQSNQSVPDKRSTIRIEIPRAGSAVVVEWPAEQAHQCAALLRDLLG
ncbi:MULTISPECIES: IS66-like element accessory protein TnpA [Marinobacter]|uniref:IS66-like element accessory protein TnpA n=1 Tax=Marinobacter TaxID=2742 RepID=UPI000E449714|nr:MULTISPECIES: transposase [Marinobacter]AXS84357.1 transposase [Marinobacter sp. Arc7-DN-1]MCK7553438.1 transposase [Marinobacter goseongensis]